MARAGLEGDDVKIALIVWDLTVSGGTQRQAIELASRLSHHDVTVYCYAFDRERCYPELTSHLRVENVAQKLRRYHGPTRPGRFAAFLDSSHGQFHVFDREIRELAELIDEPYDVLNPHDLFAEQVAYFYRRRFPHVRTVWMSNDVPRVFQSLEYVRMRPFKIPSPPRLVGRAVRRGLWQIERRRELRYIHAIDEIVVLDERNRRLVERYLQRPATVVRSGLDIERFTPKLEKNNDVFTVLGTGVLFPLRRFEDLIGAVAALAERGVALHVKIIGSDEFAPDYGEMLRAQGETLGVADRVTFLNRVSEPNLRRYYRDADVFVFPNHNQTWGLAVFEAMASGTPVIVSRTAGASEVLTDGKNALVVDPLRPEQIADALERLRIDRDLYARLQVEGLRFVQENLSWDRYAHAMEEVFVRRSPSVASSTGNRRRARARGT